MGGVGNGTGIGGIGGIGIGAIGDNSGKRNQSRSESIGYNSTTDNLQSATTSTKALRSPNSNSNSNSNLVSGRCGLWMGQCMRNLLTYFIAANYCFRENVRMDSYESKLDSEEGIRFDWETLMEVVHVLSGPSQDALLRLYPPPEKRPLPNSSRLNCSADTPSTPASAVPSEDLAFPPILTTQNTLGNDRGRGSDECRMEAVNYLLIQFSLNQLQASDADSLQQTLQAHTGRQPLDEFAHTQTAEGHVDAHTAGGRDDERASSACLSTLADPPKGLLIELLDDGDKEQEQVPTSPTSTSPTSRPTSRPISAPNNSTMANWLGLCATICGSFPGSFSSTAALWKTLLGEVGPSFGDEGRASNTTQPLRSVDRVDARREVGNLGSSGYTPASGGGSASFSSPLHAISTPLHSTPSLIEISGSSAQAHTPPLLSLIPPPTSSSEGYTHSTVPLSVSPVYAPSSSEGYTHSTVPLSVSPVYAPSSSEGYTRSTVPLSVSPVYAQSLWHDVVQTRAEQVLVCTV